MKKPLIYSLALHVFIFLILIIGTPILWKPAPEEIAISLEMLPVSNKSNVKPKKTESFAKKAEKEKIVPKSAKPKEEIKTDPAKKKEDTAKPVIPPKPDKTDVKIPEKKDKDKKKEEKKKQEEKIKPKESKEDKAAQKKKEEVKKNDESEDFDALLKTLEESTTTKDIPQKNKPKQSKELDDLVSELNDKSDSSNYNESDPLSLSEMDAIRSQIEKNWNVPAGAKDAKDLIIKLNITINPDGEVTSVKILDTNFNGTSTFYKAAAESAVRAVYRASPIQNLPVNKYDSWKEVVLTFDPSQVLY
ncbi:TonB C-terminal domain-containing protein [Rickettsiales endosymbiont of Stachyamoeba lipophora]|uniref:TonB C-terminal domain-containing protein n=1 Tax=Rickettsiales endosymbiont of Stachyamoeba lipophora TaxID=2486578 RepID=UPI000F6491F9|nr:TonB C-terminal domain-containing protein [Rickettsiales endosymbiont of Stachyamoeba lipophora]AZL15437.1 hypothetical protein EF513_02570 [Rickettsiales endosymbiont of Stachyamoeba lipophora]